MSTWIFLKHWTFWSWWANWLENINPFGRVCSDTTSTNNGMSFILLSSHGAAPSQETKPRAYTPMVLIIFSYLHLSPAFQLSVATNLVNCCCFCFLLMVLPLLFSIWQDICLQQLLLVLLHGHLRITDRPTVFLHG